MITGDMIALMLIQVQAQKFRVKGLGFRGGDEVPSCKHDHRRHDRVDADPG
eukprot:CAMPEP_0182907666 /NCGR_PEP_ID=MMETSP0034_2-20130328/34652_1 /TAXON_ID=156128 /ORGANISM="Nephroselmis pyriformis, Strain CCMP717" /LENGTH=50 /DNA_ID=CAMNT_0025043653 /DNA_START=29 /DNA_END=177 /DNA_ORIENTATION=-